MDGIATQARQVRHVFPTPTIVDEVSEFISTYMILPDQAVQVVTAWAMAAWLSDVWDSFPHLVISSPEMRCAKSRLLELLFFIVPRPRYTTSISPAALYRLVESEKPTLLMDEAQSINRQTTAAAEVFREIMNAGIRKAAKVVRCAGRGVVEFSVYSPKAFALVGEPDSILADRSLPIYLKRKTRDDKTERFLYPAVEKQGQKLKDKLERWAAEHEQQAALVYRELAAPFDIQNDRMAELLIPLQTVLCIARDELKLTELHEYANSLDERDRNQASQSTGVRLLVACKEIMHKSAFMPTKNIIKALVERSEEPWYRLNRGSPINPENLAGLLKQYAIKPKQSRDQKNRGYYAADFEEAWKRYLPETQPKLALAQPA